VNNKLSYRKQNAFNVIKTRERNTCSEFNTIFNKMLDLDFFKIARFCTLVGHNYPCTRNWRVLRFANTLFVIITVSPHRKAGSWRCPPVCLFVAWNAYYWWRRGLIVSATRAAFTGYYYTSSSSKSTWNRRRRCHVLHVYMQFT